MSSLTEQQEIAQREHSRLLQITVSVCVFAVLAIIFVAFLVIIRQGIMTGTIVLTLLSLVVGMVVSILTLLVNFFQWHSSSAPSTTATISGPLPADPPPEKRAPPTVITRVLPDSMDASELANPEMKTLNTLGKVSGDWGEAPTVEHFYGRSQELEILTQWLEVERCRLMLIQGLGGVGKTTLAATLARRASPQFDIIFWRSLQNTPRIEDILAQFLRLLPDPNAIDINIPQHIDAQIMLLIKYLRRYRCLLILDNFESVLQSNNEIGYYQPGQQSFGRLLELVGNTQHQSCLLVTSREKPRELALLEGPTFPVRSLPLSGVNQSVAQSLLQHENLRGDDQTWQRFIHLYSGNPLALKLVSELVREIFHGDLAAFLAQPDRMVSDIQDVLAQQFQRLSAFEQEILYWLAIEREKIDLPTLRADIVHAIPGGTLLEAIKSLKRHSLIESHIHASFSLQPVIMEYVLTHFIWQIQQELSTEKLQLFQNHSLIKAEATDYIRKSQLTLLLAPVNEYLHASFGADEIAAKWRRILDQWRDNAPHTIGYGAGNILNLLVQASKPIHTYDFSRLTIKQAYLQDVHLADVNFAHTDLATCTFTETFDNVLCVAFTHNQAQLAAATANGKIELWDLPAGTPHSTFQGHSDWIRSIAFSADDHVLVSGSDDQTLRIWDVQTAQCLSVLRGHQGKVYTVAISPDQKLIASGGDDQVMHIWDVNSGQCIQSLTGPDGLIRSVTFSPDGQRLLCGSDAQSITTWECSTWQQTLKIETTHGCIYALASSSDGQILASSDDHSIDLWDLQSGQHLRELLGHERRIQSVAFSPDSTLLASGGDDQALRIWDITTGACLAYLREHHNRIRSVAFNSTGSLIVSGGDDQAVRLWDVRSKQCLKTLQGHSSGIYTVASSPDGKLIAGNGADLELNVWDSESQERLKKLQGHTSLIYTTAFSLNGTWLASGSDDCTISLWDIKHNYQLQKITGQNSRIRSIAFSPDSTLLASASDDQQIHIWDIQTGRRQQILRGHHDRVRVISFIDNNTLASGSDDKSIRIWNLKHRECVETLQEHSGRIWALAYDPRNNLLASAGDDQIIRLWQRSTGQSTRIGTLTGHTDRIYTLAFSSDGAILASGSEDHTVRLWDTYLQQSQASLQEHTQRIRAVAFNPVDNTLISGSHDDTIKLWDRQTTQCLYTWRSDRPYERMNIKGARGISETQKHTLISLGAYE